MRHESDAARIQRLELEIRQLIHERREQDWLIADLKKSEEASRQRAKTLEDYHVLVMATLRRTQDAVHQAGHHLHQREMEKASLTLQQVLESLNFKKE